MKLYIPEYKLTDIKKDLIEKYLYKQQNINYIYSEEGIYKINANKIIKLQIIDKNIENYKINNILCKIDNSIIIDECEYYQIPFIHKYIKIEKNYYSLRKNAIVELVLEFNKNKIHDFYFNIKNINDNINEDILTFLFNLSFIKNI